LLTFLFPYSILAREEQLGNIHYLRELRVYSGRHQREHCRAVRSVRAAKNRKGHHTPLKELQSEPSVKHIGSKAKRR
jgi:hypothetical protein